MFFFLATLSVWLFAHSIDAVFSHIYLRVFLHFLVHLHRINYSKWQRASRCTCIGMMVDGGKPIADYSDAEIRDALIAYGQLDVPAVTSLTRSILQRKLEKLLQAGSSTVIQQQPTCAEAPSASEPAAVESASRGESTRSDQEDKPEGYYGVAAAPNEQSEVPLSPYYTSKREVLLAIKGSKLKGARFKRFESPQCAEAYSRHHGNFEAAAEAGSSSVEGRADPSPQPGTPSEAPLKTEKANSYPSLKQQNHTALRQLIEAGNTAVFAKCVWENPRHLVTAGDAPEVLQPGNRYNALHCAVRKGQLGVCKELFSIVESDSFWKLLYPDDSEDVRKDRKRRLIDLYLNVPDKVCVCVRAHMHVCCVCVCVWMCVCVCWHILHVVYVCYG